MTIERVATSMQTQYMLTQLSAANVQLDTAQKQVASGKVATDYAGYGDKTAALEAARSSSARADAYKASAQAALDQANLQDTELSTLSDLANQLRQAVTTAVANNDSSQLMSEVQSVFQQAVQALNAKDSNGNYLFGGDNNSTPPVTVSTLAGLSALPSASAAFANGSNASSIYIADGQKVTVGVLASNAATSLMQTIKEISDYNSGANGPFGPGLTGAQSTFLSGEIATAKSAAESVNNVMAANGDTYNRLKDAVSHQDTLSTLYQGFTSDIENVDMAQAVTNLNQDQTALQAALKVTSQLGQISLLNYLK